MLRNLACSLFAFSLLVVPVRAQQPGVAVGNVVGNKPGPFPPPPMLPGEEERERQRQHQLYLRTASNAARAANSAQLGRGLEFPQSPRYTPPKPPTIPAVKPSGSWRGWLAGVGAAIAGAFAAIFGRRGK